MTYIADRLSADKTTGLRELLEQCVVRIQAGQNVGTGFFITSRKILTCGHVIKSAEGSPEPEILVSWFGDQNDGRVLNADPQYFPASWPDIAILTVPDSADRVCVVLDSGTVDAGTPLLTAGYPSEALLAFQPQEYAAGYPAKDNDGKPELRITDDVVKLGQSGSPIVSLRSGLVVGILRMTKADESQAGGFGTMFRDIPGDFPDLQALIDRPPSAAKQWIDVLGSLLLKSSERDTDGTRIHRKSTLPRIDLIVDQAAGGPLEKWQIGIRETRSGDPSPIPCTTAELGDGVLRAVDGWSRRQMIRQDTEIEILGRVLDRALLPSEAQAAISNVLTTPPVLLRVCTDNAGALSQLPWEYAWCHSSEPISVNSDIAFARFVNVDGMPPEPKSRIRVLAVIEMPQTESGKFREYRDEDYRLIKPGADEFLGSIRDVLPQGQQIEFDFVSNNSRDDLQDKLAEQWDIVHYVGFAWQEPDEFVISMGCGTQGLRPVSLPNLGRDFLARSKCSVFVAEFHQLAPGREFGPTADLRVFASLLQGDMHAIIVTRQPVDIVDMRRFNETFYRRLCKGDIAESAVQSGRRAVRDEIRQGRDLAAFGSFTVTTRLAGDVCLLLPAEQGSRGSGGQTAQADGRTAGQSQADSPDIADVSP